MSRNNKFDGQGASLTAAGEVIRTDVNCTECGKNFIALLEAGLNGNHIAECPYCGHSHYRVIEAGRITGDRWQHSYGKDESYKAKRVWKSSVLPMRTSTASEFIRQVWLDRLAERN